MINWIITGGGKYEAGMPEGVMNIIVMVHVHSPLITYYPDLGRWHSKRYPDTTVEERKAIAETMYAMGEI